MNRIKELSEKRGAKLKEANALIETARTAKRDLTADENTKIAALHDECESITSTITTEARQLSLESGKAPHLSEGEERDVARFDTGKFLRGLAGIQSLDGVELEMADEGTREARSSGVQIKGRMLPRALVKRSDRESRDSTTLTATGGTSLQYGGTTVQTNKQGFYDAFFDALVLRTGGATILEGLSGNVDLNRFTAGTVPVKKAENTAAVQTSPTTDVLSLTPNRLPVFVDISGQLMMQSATSIDQWVKRNVQAQLAAVAEAAYFHGTGTTEPEGIFATSGIGSVVGGTNGAAPDLTDVIDLETAVANTNAAQGTLHYFTNTRVRGKLKKVFTNATYGDKSVWNALTATDANPLITNAISHTLTKGNQSLSSAIGYGNIADYVIGFWGGMSFEVLRDTTNAKADTYTLVLSVYHDGGVIRVASFAAMLDALTA